MTGWGVGVRAGGGVALVDLPPGSAEAAAGDGEGSLARLTPACAVPFAVGAACVDISAPSGRMHAEEG